MHLSLFTSKRQCVQHGRAGTPCCSQPVPVFVTVKQSYYLSQSNIPLFVTIVASNSPIISHYLVLQYQTVPLLVTIKQSHFCHVQTVSLFKQSRDLSLSVPLFVTVSRSHFCHYQSVPFLSLSSSPIICHYQAVPSFCHYQAVPLSNSPIICHYHSIKQSHYLSLSNRSVIWGGGGGVKSTKHCKS